MSTLLDARDSRPVHFMGICGAGMSALAELCVRRGVAVTGCDVSRTGAADLLALHVPVAEGHDPAHIDRARAVVYSSAIPQDHPELARARSAGVPVIRRAEALAEAVRGGRVVGIAGTHGKTTTTAMTTEALASAGVDPTGLAGGRVAAWNGNLRRGSLDAFVVEADEYDRSFLALDPDVAVVTNIEADHLDVYRDVAEIRDAFVQFTARARHVVICADDPGAGALPAPASAEVMRYGIASPDARLIAKDLRAEGDATNFVVWHDGAMAGDVRLQVPGEHNVLNALGALAVGLVWGKAISAMTPGLAAFTGVERRFQRIGETAGVTIVDDYAHHPTEICATLAAARTAYHGRRLVIAFQPHLYTRTRDFADAFGAALSDADVILLAEIYAAREEAMPGVTSALVVDAVRRAGGSVEWAGDRSGLADALAATVRAGDVVLTVGAGDITKTGPELLVKLSGKGRAGSGGADDSR
jgi:UDP-N-acetylmuramate--alanine ligase